MISAGIFIDSPVARRAKTDRWGCRHLSPTLVRWEYQSLKRSDKLPQYTSVPICQYSVSTIVVLSGSISS